MGAGRKWTADEIEYLKESWGTKSVKTIARTLNRTETAIIVKKDRLKLGRFDEAGDYITYSQALKAIYGIENVSSAYRSSIKGFPIKHKTIKNRQIKVVELNQLWKFLEKEKRHYDFSKMEENILGAEPDWVKEKRKIDIECRKKTTKWTKSEDERLHQYLKQYKYTYPELAVKLNRTEAAVKRRICTLKLKERAIRIEDKNWSEEEYKILKEMYQKGWSFDRIGERLGRSGLACRGKLEWLERKEKENGGKKGK